MLKIIVGAGAVTRDGWIPLQHGDLRVENSEDWARLFLPSSIDAILTEHTLEHLTVAEALAASRNFYSYLKPGGYVRCAVPDGFHSDPAYLNWVAPGSAGEQWLSNFRDAGEPDHKTLWTYGSIRQLFESAGFVVALREWFDENGYFHKTEWNQDDGYIRRCHGSAWSNVLSFVVGAPYTSLLVDAIK
jgi:predicted SAM-dependent methyltransferase